ncbi:CotH kinase family protein [Crocinitomicaceae bacterium]|nr:CotH kinase family protein [Crocinitomicaceae bacterium]
MKLLLITLFSWSVTMVFGQTFSSSHLPIVVINTGNASYNAANIPDEPKVTANIGIINTGSGTNNLTDPFEYSSPIGIETRGNSTQDFLKKTYSLELRDALGQDSSAALLGMGKEEDWILHAMVIDKTLLRIPFTFNLARQAGHYASDWRYVELVIDGDYRGVYLLCERIKRDDDRVDIAKLTATDLTGDQVTGGYILRIDWLDNPEGFASNHNAQSGDPMFFQWYYPKANNIQPAQVAYIQSYMQTFEEAVFGPNFQNSTGSHWSHYADLTSFVDFLIINEVSKNSDGYKLSSYVHKESKGGKFKAGPIWDFDQTYGHSEVCSNEDPTGWTYLQNQTGCEDLESMPMWWQTMMTDPVFTNHVACRWQTLRAGPLHLDSIYAWMDQHELLLGTAIDRNFVKWDYLGQQIWYQPEPVPADYQGEIQLMKNWIASRLAWMDANIPGDCSQDVASATSLNAPVIEVFPNPASDQLFVRGYANSHLELRSMTGQLVKSMDSTTDLVQFDVSDLSAGVYHLTIQSAVNQATKKVVIR